MSSQEDKLDPDGIRNDGVSTYPADAHRLQTYVDAEQKLAQSQSPIFIHANNPHERLYVAAFDGTGNDKNKDRQHETNVGKIDDQIVDANNPRIQSGYVAGPGTEDGWWARTRDGATGGTYEPRMEEMYKKFIDQAWKWKHEDPQAEIRVADMGFSRGGSQAAGFARMVHERGIQDPTGAHYAKDSNGLITGVTYSKPPLVAPGQVAQAEMLFDPVSTGAPMEHDRRPPPSVVSGFQIIAEDEKRPAFRSDHIIDPGQTPDGRFLGVTVAGAHSDIGGSYHRDGLGLRNENLAINYLNSLSDTPYLQNVAEPNDPRLNVVHRSEEGFPFGLDPRHYVNRDQPGGYNERLVSQETTRNTQHTPHGPVTTVTHAERTGVRDPYNAEPRDAALGPQFERHMVHTGQPQQATPEPQKEAPKSELDQWIDRMYKASQNPDNANWDKELHAGAQNYMRSPDGQQFQQQANDLNKAWDAQLQQAALEAQQREQAAQQAVLQQTQQRSPGFSL